MEYLVLLTAPLAGTAWPCGHDTRGCLTR